MVVRGTVFSFFLLLVAVFPLSAYEGGSRDIFFKVAAARDTQPPVIMEDKLILVYKPPEPTRFIGAAFGHENFRIPHPFKINEYGVFFLVYPLPQGEPEITYRLIVDGLWMADLSNPRRIHDSMGISLSLFPIPEKDLQDGAPPHLDAHGKITFSFRASPGEKIYLAGSFNRWDPFMYRMQESPTIPGLYRISLSLGRGTHYYNYLYRGIPLTDPKNENISLDANAREVSELRIP